MCAAPLPGKAVSPSAMAFKTCGGQDRGCRVRTVSGSAALAKLAAEVAGLRRRSSSRSAPFRPSVREFSLARQGGVYEISRQHPWLESRAESGFFGDFPRIRIQVPDPSLPRSGPRTSNVADGCPEPRRIQHSGTLPGGPNSRQAAGPSLAGHSGKSLAIDM